MQIVIDIDERIYDIILADKRRSIVTLKLSQFDKLDKAIRNGTPLPEHHGRLISEEDMLSVIMFSKLFDNANVGEVKEALLNIPTIIEAEGSEIK